MASAGARARLEPDGVVVATAAAARVLVRVRWTPYWRLAGGRGCVAASDGWTVLDADAAGRYVLTARFSVAGLVRARVWNEPSHVLALGSPFARDDDRFGG